MRPVAFTIAVFWSLQAAVCLAPSFETAATESQAHVGDSERHSLDTAEVGQPEAEQDHGSPHSHGSAPDHHQDPDSGCAQHCTSLTQTITGSPGSVPDPDRVCVAIVPASPASDRPTTQVLALAILELGRPPPDLLARNSTLRI